MGYETNFNLAVINGDRPSVEDVAKTLNEVMGDPDPDYWKSVLRGDQPCQWYEYTENMVEVSRHYPGVVFSLNGCGEEPGDEWIEYYRDGKFQAERRPEWVPPPFDHLKLRDLE